MSVTLSPPGARWRTRRANSRRDKEGAGTTYRVGWVSILVIVILLYLVAVPALFMVLSALKPNGVINDPGLTLENVVTVYTDPYVYEAFFTTILYAGVSTLIAVVCGAGLAWLVERTDIPGARVLRTVILMGLAIPPFMLAIAYLLLLSPQIGILNRFLGSFSDISVNLYTLPGMIVVQGLGTVATVYLIVAPSFRGLDSTLEEAAATSGASPLRTAMTVVLPLVKPAMLSAGIVSLMIGFTSFDIPGVIGMRNNIYVLSSEMYRQIHSVVGLPAYGEVSVLGVTLLVLLLILAKVYHRQTRQTRRFITTTGKGRTPKRFQLGRARIPLLILAWFFMTWYLILPTAVLAWTSFLPYLSTAVGEMWSQLSLTNYAALFSDANGVQSLWNSALLTLITPTVVVLLAFLASWMVVRSRVRGRRLIDNLAFIPFSMPDVVIGISILITYLSLRFLPIYGSIWIVMIALITSYLAYGTRVTNAGLMQIHPELEEAAQVSGASWGRMLRTITFQLARPAVLAVWIWVATHALRALTAPLFLQSGNNPTLSTLLWDFWALGSPTVTAAGGFLMVVVLMVAVGAWQAIDRRSEKRPIR